MYAYEASADTDAIVSFDDNGDFIFEMHDCRIGNGHAECSRKLQAEMFILGMAVELAGWWFEDVGRRNAAGGKPPAAIEEQQGSFGLRARQTELSGIAGKPPRGVVGAQGTQPLSNDGFVEPLYICRGLAADGADSLRRYELDCASAVFSDV